MQPRLIVHAGAWDIPKDQEADHLAGMRCAVSDVFPKLEAGMSALDAVEAAVRVLEDNPALNAGRGAVLNARGEIELDAMLMDGKALRVGAVAAVRNILHPVSLARAVMDRSEHCFLVGPGALEFARTVGIPEVDPRELLTERELAYYREHVLGNGRCAAAATFGAVPADTVGAVAMDLEGNLAAATSTGGAPGKLPGRVGDSPLVGAGAYADNEAGAVSTTGWGEYIMRVVLAKTACDLLTNLAAPEAARAAIAILEKRVHGLGGLILIDRHGSYGFAHNTPKMAFALMDPGKRMAVAHTCE
jgi:beta-aspartyl-peptidase (threonine type)